MRTSSDPAACRLLIAALLLSGIAVGLFAEGARAQAQQTQAQQDNCLAAPGAAPAAGQHWYYRTDRAKNRKCWYLHATLPPRAAAAAPSASLQPAPAATTPSAYAEPAPDALPQQPAPPSNPAGRGAVTSAHPWCAYFTGGPTHCDFARFEDCLAAIKGKTAVCVQNAQYVPPAKPATKTGG